MADVGCLCLLPRAVCTHMGGHEAYLFGPTETLGCASLFFFFFYRNNEKSGRRLYNYPFMFSKRDCTSVKHHGYVFSGFNFRHFQDIIDSLILQTFPLYAFSVRLPASGI